MKKYWRIESAERDFANFVRDAEIFSYFVGILVIL
jgi:hypothetical protein